MAESEDKKSFLNSSLFGTLVGAVVGAAALFLGGVQATNTAHRSDEAQAQLQVESTRRAVYAEFVAASSDVCTTLEAIPFDKVRTDSAFSAFVGKGSAVVLVAPQDVADAAQKVNDYLLTATGPGPDPKVPVGCNDDKFFSLVNEFIAVAKNELRE